MSGDIMSTWPTIWIGTKKNHKLWLRGRYMPLLGRDFIHITHRESARRREMAKLYNKVFSGEDASIRRIMDEIRQPLLLSRFFEETP